MRKCVFSFFHEDYTNYAEINSENVHINIDIVKQYWNHIP